MQKKFNKDELHAALSFIHETLEDLRLAGKELSRAELICEESLLRLMKYSDFNTINYFIVRVRKNFGNVFVDLSVPGEEFDFAGSIELLPSPEDYEFSPESQAAIQNLIFRSQAGNITFRHSGHFNTITVKALSSSYSNLYKVLTALGLAIAAGLSMRAFLPDELCMTINNNFFSVVSSLFLNGLKMCAVPIIFFSIILCFADLKNLSGIKRAGTKLFSWFILFQVVAVSIGFTLVFIFGTGKGAGLSLTSRITDGQDFALSLGNMITNLMPDNMIRPFLEGKVLQLIIFAVLAGLAAGISGAKIFLSLCAEVNTIFMRITAILINLVPWVVFCSVSSMIITTGLNTVITFTGILFTLLAGHALMNIIFCLVIKLSGLNPAVMYKKFMNAIITAFSTCSSNATIPDMMNAADKMGISRKFYPFAVPFTTSISKPIFCLYMSVIILSAANMYGLNLALSEIISLAVSIIILVIASPSVPGAGPAQLSIMFIQMGLPLDLLAPIIAVTVIEDMSETPTHCVSVITSTLLAAKSEKLLDIEEYNKI